MPLRTPHYSPDAGLAHEYWKNYFTPAEVDEIVKNSSTTMMTSQGYPIYVRRYLQNTAAPTVLQSHGLLPYGLMLARLQLPYFRAGFNVVQWDLPGFGLSGGARGGCTIPEIIQCWKDMLDWTWEHHGGPIYIVGYAEDGVTAYYANANDPRVTAMTLHILTEYGDPDNVHWQGPGWLVKLKTVGVGMISKMNPAYSVNATEAIPWDDVFGRPEDAHFRQVFENDPLRVQKFEFRLAYSMLKNMKPDVPFEQCTTPIQLVASERSQIWPYEMNLKYFQRLSCEKELITLANKPHWEFNRQFDEMFSAHAIRWFVEHGAFNAQSRNPNPQLR